MERTKNRLLWTLILGVGFTALYCAIVRPEVTMIPEALRDPLADLKPLPPPPLELPPLVIPEIPLITPPVSPAARGVSINPPPEVPIQDRATIDFSTGAPVVKRHGADQDALDAALKEMADVAKGTKIEAKK